MLQTVGEAIIWFLLFIISVTFHEAAHAWIAKLGGDTTAYEGGQVSLNPIPHIRRQPVGMLILPLVTVFLIGWPFGFASTPYDVHWAHKYPKRSALMSLAGPTTHLIFVILSVLAVKVGIMAGFFAEPWSVSLMSIVEPGPSIASMRAAQVLSIFFSLNLIMLVLNLLPLPPLDGSTIIPLFMKDDAARKYHAFITNPAFGFFGLFLAWQVFDPLFDVVFLWVINLIYWPGGFA